MFYNILKIKKLLITKANNRLFSASSNLIESIEISTPNIIAEKVKIREACIVNLAYPPHYHNFLRPNRLFPERNTFLVKNCKFIKLKGAIVYNNKKLLMESYGSLRRLLFWDSVIPFINGKTINIKSNKNYYYLRYTGFYHFLLEEIPALLYVLKNHGNISILKYKKQFPGFYYELLRLILSDEQYHSITESNFNLKPTNIVFTQRDGFSGSVHINDIMLLNKKIIPRIEKGICYDKVYISRANLKKRSIANEKDIEALLKKSGFNILYLENLKVTEQIQATMNATIIIAAHGAGLSHLIWNPDKKKSIVEIFPSYIKNDCYASMAITLNYKYDYIICNRTGSKETCDIDKLKSKLL